MRKTKLKYHFKFGMGETILREEVSDNPTDGYPVYSATESDTVFGYKSDIKRVLDAGDIIIAARGTIGSVNILKEKGGCTQTTMYMKNLGDFNSYYVYYYLLGHRDTMFAYDKTAIPQLTISKFSNEEILLPSIELQNKIVAFLDAETAKIDNLVDELTKFKANLLLQKRSLVSECVTKGIPSERDSIKAYPLKRLKQVCNINGTKISTNLGDGEIVSFIPMEALKEDIYFERDKPLGEVKQGYTHIKDGDVVLAKVTPCFENHNMAVIDNLRNGFAFGSTEIVTLTPYDKITKRFLYYVISTNDFNQQGVASMQGNGGLKRISSDFLNNFKLPLPPLEEQQRIANYLDTETAKINALIGEIDNQVNLLKTYRKSLINEVVTGKVEV